MKRRVSDIRAVVAVVPIKDEERLLGRCIASLKLAITHSSMSAAEDVRVIVTLVLDTCSDGSAEIARASSFDVIEVEHCNVGMARSVGIDHALRTLGDLDASQVWIANTDADSAVPPNWLSHQLALARSGFDVMLGTVRPDPQDLNPSQRAIWEATHVPGAEEDHVYGANLGLRAEIYRSVGGFQPLPEHEDVRLAEVLRDAGARFVSTDDCWVLTSGRTIGRTPGGYAGYIRDKLTPA